MKTWRRTTIGEVALVVTKGTTPTTGGGKFSTSGVNFVKVESITKNGFIDHSRVSFIDEQTHRSLKRSTLMSGDILFTIAGTIGRVARVVEDLLPANTNQAVALIRPNPAVVDEQFLYYALRHTSQVGNAASRVVQSVQANLSLSELSRTPLLLPTLSEQRAIADTLGALDGKMASNERAALAARELSNAHFLRSLTLEPGRHHTLGELADRKALTFSDGYRTKRSEYGTPGIRILRAGDVRHFRAFPDGPDYVSDELRSRIGEKVSRDHDIVLTTKGTVGRVAVIPPGAEEVVYSPQMCYFRVLDESVIDFGYLAAWFGSRNLADQLSRVMHKSDMAPYVNLQDVSMIRVPVPAIAVQQLNGSLQRSLIGYMHALSKENDVLARARDDLMPLLMSGRTRVRDGKKILAEVI